MDEIFAAIDIGTSKTAVVIAEETDSGLSVRGFGIAPNDGVVRGIVVNIEKAEQGILRALSIAEKQAQLKVKHLIVSFGGNQTKVIKSHGVTTIPRERGKVTPTDVAKLIETAKSVPLPKNAEIIDYAVNDFIVDGARGIIDPVGMATSRLEGNVLLFVAQSAALHNLFRALDDANIVPLNTVASPIAAAEAILTDEEKELGAVLMDIGAGTTDIVIYKDNRPQLVTVIPYAGESVTHDLMVGLKLTRQAAEKVKQSFGCAVKDAVPEDETVEVMGIGGREPRQIPKYFIAMIMEARLEEIFSMVREYIEEAGGKLDNEIIPAGIVLVGGSTLTEQLVYLVERVLNMPVRVGLPGDRTPVPDGMNTPDYHNAWGSALISAHRQRLKEQVELEQGKLSALWNKIKRKVLKKL